jgi:hypothetical protein
MLHAGDVLAVFILVLMGGAMLNQLFSCKRMLALAKAGKLDCSYGA